tara:strand:+ start:404 stop:3793 length:3390 start_codon:yes stop_codon:yes gene_type:complete
MAKYPLISSNTATALNLKTAHDDGAFDAYVYTNPAGNTNNQRANIVITIKNAAVAGSNTNLEIQKIEIKRSDAGNGATVQAINQSTSPTTNTIGDFVQGFQIAPLVSGVPYVGDPDTTAGNKILATSPVTLTSEAEGAAGFLTINGAGNVTTSSIGSTPGGYDILPIYTAEYLTAYSSGSFVNPIPDNSYATFIVAYQPSEIHDGSEIFKLYITTNIGAVVINLNVSSYNEIHFKGELGDRSSGSWVSSGINIFDGGNYFMGMAGTVTTGCFPATRTISQLRSFIGSDDTIKVHDQSTFSTGNYKWQNIFINNGSAGTDEEPMNEPTGAYGNASNEYTDGFFMFTSGTMKTWELGFGGTEMQGSSNAETSYGTTKLYKTFSPDETTNLGTRRDGAIIDNLDNTHYNAGAPKENFMHWKAIHMLYDPEDYNPDDYTPVNKHYSMGFAWGVYQRLTSEFDTSASEPPYNITVIENLATPKSVQTSQLNDAPAGIHRNAFFLQNGHRIINSAAFKWNNFSNVKNLTYNTYIPTFSWDDNVDLNAGSPSSSGYGRLTSTDGVDSYPISYNPTGEGGYTTAGDFAEFDTTLDQTECYFKWKLRINRSCSSLYTLTNNYFDKAADVGNWDFYDVTFKTHENDLLWNNSATANNPGLYPERALHYKFTVGPTLPHLVIVPKDTAETDAQHGGIPATDNEKYSDDGLGTFDFDGQIIKEACNWYNLDGSDFDGDPESDTTNVGNDTNSKHKFSGYGGLHLTARGTNPTTSSVTSSHVDDFMDTNSSWNGGAGQPHSIVDPNYWGIVNNNGGSIKSFVQDNNIYDLGNTKISPSDSKYYAYGTFKLANMSDNVEYIHSINTYNANIVDIDVTDAGNNNNSLANAGYKPNTNSPEAKLYVCIGNGSTNPFTGISSASQTVFGFHEKKAYYGSGSFADLSAGDGLVDHYRNQGSVAHYVSPIRKYNDLDDGTTGYSKFANNNPTSGTFDPENIDGHVPDWTKLVRYNGSTSFQGTQKYEGSPGAGGSGDANNPHGDQYIHLLMEVDPNNDLNDLGTYRKKIEIVTYNNMWQNRKNISSGAVINQSFTGFKPPSDDAWKLHVSSYIIKATVIPEPVLEVSDADNQQFISGSSVDMQDINIG